MFTFTKTQWLILAGTIFMAWNFIREGHPPEWFDTFGIFCFSFLGYIGYKMVKKEKLPNWTGFVVLLIAILGLIVDGYIVFHGGL